MKKLILLFTIMCASQLYGMEPEKLTPIEATDNPYKQLPKELQQEIIDAALASASSTNITEAINTIKKLSVLHNMPINKDKLMYMLTKKFPDTIKDVIALAVEKPIIYQKVADILNKSKDLDNTIAILKQEKLLQDNLKNFTTLVHMLNNTIGRAISDKEFNTPLAKEYKNINDKLLYSILVNDSIETVQTIENDTDVNYINWLSKTPLSMAIQKNRVDLVKILLDAGANPNLKVTSTDFKYVNTPLFDALQTIFLSFTSQYINFSAIKVKQIVQLLLAYGAVPDQETIQSFDRAVDRFKESIRTLNLKTTIEEIRQMLTRKIPR